MVASETTSPTETIKSTVTASGQNKESFFSHNSATFRLLQAENATAADKDDWQDGGGGGKLSSGKADLVSRANAERT